MTVFQQSYEGTNGSAITITSAPSGDTNFAAVTTAAGGAQTFDNTRAAHGTLSRKIVGSTSGGVFGSWNTGTKTIRWRKSIYLPTATANIATDVWLMAFYVTGTKIFELHITGARKFRYTDIGGSATQFSSANAIAMDTWIRVEVEAQIGSGSADGTVRFAYFAGDSTTPIETESLITNRNLGGTAPTNVTDGQSNQPTVAYTWWEDDLIVDSGGTGFIGPVAVVSSTIYPTSVQDNTGVWTNQGGAADIPTAMSDGSNATYIQSVDTPTTANTITMKLGGTLDLGAVQVTFTADTDSTTTRKAKIQLLQGTSTVISQTADQTMVQNTPTDFNLTLTGPENASITDRSNLYVRLIPS